MVIFNVHYGFKKINKIKLYNSEKLIMSLLINLTYKISKNSKKGNLQYNRN